MLPEISNALIAKDGTDNATRLKMESPNAKIQMEEWNSAELIDELDSWPAPTVTTQLGGTNNHKYGTIPQLHAIRMPTVTSFASVTQMDTREHATRTIREEPDARISLMELMNTADLETEEWPALIETTPTGGAMITKLLPQLPRPQDGGVIQEE